MNGMMAKGWVASVLAVLALGCGSDQPSGEASETGLEPGLLLSHLSEGERNSFCAWVVDIQGGEGTDVVCSDVMYDLSIAACLEAPISRMTVSVAEAEACALDMVEAGELCSVPDTEACAPVRAYLESLPPTNATCKGTSGGGKTPSGSTSSCDPPTWGGA